MKRIYTPTSDRFSLVAKGRAAALAALVLLAGCGGEEEASEAVSGSQAEEQEREARIPCALDGSEAFAQVCTHTVIPGERGRQLLLEAPDGSFRRFLIVTDGRGLEASDGAEKPSIRLLDDNRIEVAIGGDRYRLPARLRRPDEASPAQ